MLLVWVCGIHPFALAWSENGLAAATQRPGLRPEVHRRQEHDLRRYLRAWHLPDPRAAGLNASGRAATEPPPTSLGLPARAVSGKADVAIASLPQEVFLEP